MAWQNSNGTVTAYKAHRKVLQDVLGEEPKVLSLYRARSLAEELTQLHPHSIDMCPNSCIAYTGSYADLHSCPYVKKGKTACGIA
jgi:hypothetical protein